MSREVVPLYLFEKTFDEVKNTRFRGLYASGTLGHPKPVFWNHLAVSSLASQGQSVPNAEEHHSSFVQGACMM